MRVAIRYEVFDRCGGVDVGRTIEEGLDWEEIVRRVLDLDALEKEEGSKRRGLDELVGEYMDGWGGKWEVEGKWFLWEEEERTVEFVLMEM